MEQEACQDWEHIQLLIINYQALIESLRKWDEIIQKQFNQQDTRLARHHENINGAMTDINQLLEDQVRIIARMTRYKDKASRCGENSDCLSNMSYAEPLVTSGSGRSFPSESSSQPIPIPPLATSVSAVDIPVSSLGSSDLDKENSSQGSFQSTQQAVNKLVEIVEADPEVDDEEARILSDVMDAEVRSCSFQRCKSKKHPHRFAPFPKCWKADRARE